LSFHSNLITGETLASIFLKVATQLSPTISGYWQARFPIQRIHYSQLASAYTYRLFQFLKSTKQGFFCFVSFAASAAEERDYRAISKPVNNFGKYF